MARVAWSAWSSVSQNAIISFIARPEVSAPPGASTCRKGDDDPENALLKAPPPPGLTMQVFVRGCTARNRDRFCIQTGRLDQCDGGAQPQEVFWRGL
ncbi:MAG: hypothetical protein Q9173_000054 [Seirophora scorigena]